MTPIKPKDPLIVPPEIWIQVSSKLYVPIPPPLSRPDRSLLRQHALTVTAQVSKLFNAISEKWIYTTPATDRFDLFLADCGSPSRQRQLSYTQSLFIEYREERTTISYETILSSETGHIWSLVPTTEGLGLEWTGFAYECRTEACALLYALRGAFLISPSRLFPSLGTVAVSSIYGNPQTDRWAQTEVKQREWLSGDPESTKERTASELCGVIWTCFVHGIQVKHLCTRDTDAPLVISYKHYETFITGKPSIADVDMTVHFASAREPLLIVSSIPNRWSSDVPVDEEWEQLYTQLAGCANAAASERRPRPLLLDIYCSTERVGNPVHLPVHSLSHNAAGVAGLSDSRLRINTQREIATKLGTDLQERMRKATGKKDTIRWHCSADMPICLACGSGLPT